MYLSKTTLQNFYSIPHIKEVLVWFLQNDAQISLLNSDTIKWLFKEGYRPICSKENDPNNLEVSFQEVDQSIDIHIIEGWLIIRTWLDIFVAKNNSEKNNINLEQTLKNRIDLLDKAGTETIIATGELVIKYNIDPVVNDLDKELNKIPTESERESFKQNYLADTLIAAEMRLLAWIYRELFNKDYKISK